MSESRFLRYLWSKPLKFNYIGMHCMSKRLHALHEQDIACTAWARDCRARVLRKLSNSWNLMSQKAQVAKMRGHQQLRGLHWANTAGQRFRIKRETEQNTALILYAQTNEFNTTKLLLARKGGLCEAVFAKVAIWRFGAVTLIKYMLFKF